MRIIVFAILLTALTALSFNSFANKTKPLAAKADVKQVIAVVNKMIDGKKTWVPSHQTIKANQATEIVVVNTLNAVHGFEISGHVKPIALLPLETKKITLNKTTVNTKLKISCHMHPAHVGSTIVAK